MFGSNINDDQNAQHNVQENIIHNENNIISDFPANYTSQNTTLTNDCLCTCCHKTDIPLSQCIIFKESKYNYDNTVVVEALSHRFSVPTSKEYICKKCDKDLLEEIMPMNTVPSQIWLTSNEPQQKCIHCNIVCIEKFLTFNKTKYGQNTIVSQMIENDAQNIICNKCHNAICRESLVTCLICKKTVKKCTLKFDINTYSSLENKIQEMAKSQKTNSYICKTCYVELQQKLHVCVVTDICRNMYVKCTTNFCCITMLTTCIKFCTWRTIHMFIMWQKIKRNNWWKPSCTILC